MDRVRFWRHSTPLVGVSSGEMITVFETVINGEPLDWLWSQASSRASGCNPYDRDSVDWVAVLDDEVSGDGYSLMRPGEEPRRIPVMQVLRLGSRIGTMTVSISTTATGVVSWSHFESDDGQPVDLGPFAFGGAAYRRALAVATNGPLDPSGDSSDNYRCISRTTKPKSG